MEPSTGARQLACVVLFLTLGAGGCNRKDADRFAKLGARLEQKTEALLTPAHDRVLRGMPAVRSRLGELALDARVAARLTSDKALADVTIQVQAIGNVVELRGKVRDLDQKRRAFELAQTTLGVDKVNDRLEIAVTEGPN